MEKETIGVSRKLINSILLGFFLSLIIVIVGHLFTDNWSFMPVTEYSGGKITGGSIPFSLGSKVSSCSYECLFGRRHSSDCTGITASDVGKQSIPLNEVLTASFEHIALILIIGLILSVIVYLFHMVKLKMVD